MLSYISGSVDEEWCLRCLLLVMCTYPFAKKALTLHLARGESLERYFGCNLMQRKVLASSHQHLMAEAPARIPRASKLLICGLFQKGRVLAQDGVWNPARLDLDGEKPPVPDPIADPDDEGCFRHQVLLCRV